MRAETMLKPDTVLNDRFRIVELAGHGAFTNVYRAADLIRGDACVVRELFPAGSTREANGVVNLACGSESDCSHLRNRFIQESKLQGRLRVPGLVQVRAAFSALGTAYCVTDAIPHAQTLREIVEDHGLLQADRVESIFRAALAILKDLHAAGVLHRDVRPSNLLLTPTGSLHLIDMGAAREWEADRTDRHDDLRERSFAAPEQLCESMRRAPATDLYGLCASMWFALTGQAPGQSTLTDVMQSACPERLRQALAYGLQNGMAERPPSAEALLRVLDGETRGDQADDTLESFDQRAKTLKELRFERFECPSCQGVLESPRPLRKHQCPVCRQGTIRPRKLDHRLCPNCRQSPWDLRSNTEPIAICPMCSVGLLESRKKGLFSKERMLACPECDSIFVPAEAGMTLVQKRGRETEQVFRPYEEWMDVSRRAATFRYCFGCGAQFDVLDDGRLHQVVPARTLRYDTLYRDEWARVAAGLPPHAGNAECDSCGADYVLDERNATLLHADLDPFGFDRRHRGRLMTLEQMRWLGVGKESPNAGLVCLDCETEFDVEGEQWRLIYSPDARLLEHAAEPLAREDWHRLAHGVPKVAEEAAFFRDFDQAIREAYCAGHLSLDDRKRVLWKDHAMRLDIEEGRVVESGAGALVVDEDEITFGGLIRKWRTPLESIREVELDGDVLWLKCEAEAEPIGFRLNPIELTAALESGPRTIKLDAQDLERRLLTILGGLRA